MPSFLTPFREGLIVRGMQIPAAQLLDRVGVALAFVVAGIASFVIGGALL